MAKFVNDDGTFAEGFEQNIDPDLRDYAKQFRDLPAALKAGRDNQREFRERVKIPTEADKRREFLTQHFKPELDADEQKRKTDAEAEKKKAEETAATAQADKLK